MPASFPTRARMARSCLGIGTVRAVNNATEQRRFYRPKEVANMSGLSRSALQSALERGEIRAQRWGTRVLIPADEVERWLAAFCSYEPRRRQISKHLRKVVAPRRPRGGGAAA